MSMIGKSLAHYEVTAEIGKGGMGEVYQAKDRKLGRDVAIKVLPEEFAKDADRVARFQREAKLLASLNHQNIAAIYGLEESDGTHFLVLELIEGHTLAERIKSGFLDVEEALKVGLQIAEALEAAHEQGIIHRDLKPANIKVTSDGKVKVLDFGLAKAYAGSPEDINLSNSPTLSDAATLQGVILGTAAYMSPEQAKGKAVDKRADIWAFGVVLFEMLTGKQVFTGETVSDTLASVLAREPQWQSLPPNLHPRIRFLLERCLEKETKNRYRDIADARVEIQKVLADPGGVFAQTVTAVESKTKSRQMLLWASATIILIIIAGIVVWNLRTPEPLQKTTFYYELPEDQQFNQPVAPEIAVSPDGRQFVYCANGGLYLRSIGEMEARLISGTADENPMAPFFSPDGKWIAYVSIAGSQLKKIAIGGGSSIGLCDVKGTISSVYWADDKIIFVSQNSSSIMQIPANGGTAELLFEKEEGSAAVALPHMLPDGKTVLYTKIVNQQNLSIMVRSLESGETKEIIAGAIARYLPTGHLVYIIPKESGSIPLEGTLYALPFDADKLEVIGDPVSMNINVSGLFGCRFAVSDSGTLAYTPGTGASLNPLGRVLVWLNRDKQKEELTAPPKIYRFPKISPDGTRVAFAITDLDAGNVDIWIWDFERKTLDRLTTHEGRDQQPIWTPDSKRIVFSSTRDGGGDSIYWKAANGTGEAELLCSVPDRSLFPFSFSGDGKTLVTGETDLTGSRWDIWMLSMEGEHERTQLLHDDDYNMVQPQVSPDGHWIAYCTGISGQNEVYVRPFPNVEKDKWTVSTNGGSSPRWTSGGKELLYLNTDNELMTVAVKTEPTFSLGKPKVLFGSNYISDQASEGIVWDVHPNGKRFLMMRNPGTNTEGGTAALSSRKINIVLNWFEELKDRVPID
jgi:serine/threonine protein kinase